jgi:hypothetical protein
MELRVQMIERVKEGIARWQYFTRVCEFNRESLCGQKRLVVMSCADLIVGFPGRDG